MTTTSRKPEILIAQRRDRLRDIQQAIVARQSISWLAQQWNVTKPAAIEWIGNNAPPDVRAELADNGRIIATRKLRAFDLGKRLEMLALCRKAGWSWQDISDAFGVSTSSLFRTLRRHAPDGLEQAAADYRDDEPEQSAAA